MKVVATSVNAGDAARQALESCISKGGVALFPADGLYGLACDPLNEKAIRRIHEIKGRDDGKPSAVMYLSPLAMRELIRDLGQRVSEAAARLLRSALPRGQASAIAARRASLVCVAPCLALIRAKEICSPKRRCLA